MLIATSRAVYAWEGSGASAAPARIVADEAIHALAQGNTVGLIVVEGAVLLERAGNVRRVEIRMQHEISSVLILTEHPLRALLGTQEARLYEFTAASGYPKPVEQFDRLSCRDRWYTPWGGPPAVRSLAASSDHKTIYADIHVGSIMRSVDEGHAWEPVTPDLHEDVHQVATSLAAPQRVYANTADAVYVSDDRGRSWDHRSDALAARYGRAIAVHPADPDTVLASVSNGPRGGSARLYRSTVAGRHWTHVTRGFPPQSERNIDTFQVAFSPDGTAWAAVDRTLYTGMDRGRDWFTAWTFPEGIRCIACEPRPSPAP